MSEKWAMLAFTCESAEFALATLDEFFLPVGLSLEFPGTRYVKVLDEIGEAIDFLREDLAPLLDQRQSISFQWWWDDSVDLRCGIRLLSGVAIVDFDLSGYYDADEMQVLSCFRDIYGSLCSRTLALGFLVDRTGITALYPWFNILTGRDYVHGQFPDELVVPRATGQRLLNHATVHVEASEDGDNVILRCTG